MALRGEARAKKIEELREYARERGDYVDREWVLSQVLDHLVTDADVLALDRFVEQCIGGTVQP